MGRPQTSGSFGGWSSGLGDQCQEGRGSPTKKFRTGGFNAVAPPVEQAQVVSYPPRPAKVHLALCVNEVPDREGTLLNTMQRSLSEIQHGAQGINNRFAVTKGQDLSNPFAGFQLHPEQLVANPSMHERLAQMAQHSSVAGDLHDSYTGPQKLSVLSAREQQIFHQMKGDDKKFFKEMTGPVPLAKSIMSGKLEDYHYNNLNNLNEHDSLNVLLLKLHHIPPCNAIRHSQHAHQQTKSASDIGTDLHLPASWQHLRDSLEPMRSMVEIVYGKMFASQTFDWLDRKMLAWKELGASFTLSYFWYCAVLRGWSHRTEL